MSALEKEVEVPVCTWAKKKGFIVCKVRFVEVGYPDRLFLSPKGHTIFIEFKRLGEQPDPLQAYRLRELKKRGIPAFCCDTVHGAISILQTCLGTEELPEASNTTPLVTSIRRAITGPGAGQDVDGPSYDKDPQKSGTNPCCIDSSAERPDGEDMA